MQEEGCNIVFPASGISAAAASNRGGLRQLHTPRARSTGGAQPSGLPLNRGNVAPSASVRADAWTSAQRQLSDFWLGIPCALVLLHTYHTSFLSFSPPTTSITYPLHFFLNEKNFYWQTVALRCCVSFNRSAK